jgi:multimeric flavodoxin WrbA
MRVLALNGSPRKSGNTALLIDEVLARLEDSGIATEHVSLAGHRLAGCNACDKCSERRDLTCALKDDGFNVLMAKMAAAEGIILGSPVYFGGVTATMKALLERAGYVSVVCDGVLRRKVGAAVVAVRRAGAVSTFDSMNHLFLTCQMVVVGSSYWNLGIGHAVGEVREDREGIETMRNLGDAMAWVLCRLHGDNMEQPTSLTDVACRE